MELSISTLLTAFTDDKLVAPKVLEKKLLCEDEDSLRRLQIALDALEKIGVLAKDRGKYRRISEEGVIEGRLRCSSKGFCFAIQDVEGAEDIYIRESQLSKAWNGDRVLVKVTKEGRRRRSPEGEVRLILERANPSVIARVKQIETGFAAVPLDDRLLFELELQPSEAVPDLAAAVDQLVHVEILRYPLAQYPPYGRVTQILGSDAQSASSIELVCCKYDLPRGFSKMATEAADSLPNKVRKTDTKKRLDLRETLTVAIAAPGIGAQLQDHALSLTQTEAGNWQLGVHIADVAHYVEADAALDREAWKRGIAVYLDDLLIPLLPPQLSNQLNHLASTQERLAVSVLITLSPAGELVEYAVHPSLIQVDQTLSYEQVQEMIDRPDAAGDTDQSPVASLVHQLHQVSQMLQQQRYQRGSFDLISPALQRPQDSDEGLTGAVVQSQYAIPRVIISESLILANQLLATHLQALGIPAIYCTQGTPELYDAQELVKLTGNLGLSLGLSQEEQVLPQDYQTFSRTLAATENSSILVDLLLNTLKPITYSAAPGPHFGLALSTPYGHFTSPLRRYGDLLNQRILHAVFAEGRDRRTTRAKERVNLHHSSCHGQISWNVLSPETQRELEAAIASTLFQLNERTKLTQQAARDLDGLQKTKQMQERTGEDFRGIITGIQSYGFFVKLETLMVEGLVHVSSLKDDWYEYRSRQQTLIGRKNRQQYRLGDYVDVRVKSVDYYRQQIDLVVVGGGSEATDEDLEDIGEEFEPETDYDENDED